jgi:hypothetical protein
MRRPAVLLIALVALTVAAPAMAVTPSAAPAPPRATAGMDGDDVFAPRRKSRKPPRGARRGRDDSRVARAHRIEKKLWRDGCDEAYETAVESRDDVQVNQVIARCSRKR